MSVQHVHLKNFTVFEDLALDFSPGINVFLGANGTGKSHLMKVLYAVLRAWRYEMSQSAFAKEKFQDVVGEQLFVKLLTIFHVAENDFSRLTRENAARNSASFSVRIQKAEVKATVDGGDGLWQAFSGHENFRDGVPQAIFIPAREVLSMYEGFTSAYENRELSFDGTYYDICKALSATPLKGPKAKQADLLLKPLKDRLKADVKRTGDRFYVQMPDEPSIEAHLVAEGHRKLATLIYLIKNGSLTKESVLFWDEPEANLNPRLIKTVADFLLKLAASGIQIFVATHDYLLTNELSLHAEYHTEASKKAEIRFFGFHREGNGPAQVQTGAMLADLDQNPIMEEFAALYERERKLFREAGSAEKPGA